MPALQLRALKRQKNLLLLTLLLIVTYAVLHHRNSNSFDHPAWRGNQGEAKKPAQNAVKEEESLLNGASTSGNQAEPPSKEDLPAPGAHGHGTQPLEFPLSEPKKIRPGEPIRENGPGKSGHSSKEGKEKQDEKPHKEAKSPEQVLHEQFEHEYEKLGRQPSAGALFGNTLNTLENKTFPRKPQHEAALRVSHKNVDFSWDEPSIFDPYPQYNQREWLESNRGPYVPCNGPNGVPVQDVTVFKGIPKNFPRPSFGSYDVLDLDSNLCFERQARVGPYGSQQHNDTTWTTVRWGQLQENCSRKNEMRFQMSGTPNPYLDTYNLEGGAKVKGEASTAKSGYEIGDLRRKSRLKKQGEDKGETFPGKGSKYDAQPDKEERSVVLIRTYTGHKYSENDKQTIRSMISELSLRTGGQYQVFLLVHVKDDSLAIWEKNETYQRVLNSSVPAEFADMAILWNEAATRAAYPKLSGGARSVHVAQWLSVQQFAQDFPEFDYIWNWELDSRVVGHHWDFLEKLARFAQKQPRRGLWERNERYYIPSFHGDYDEDFRAEVERRYGNKTVWGPPELPFIKPVGPRPPVDGPEKDAYQWGIGEEADLITVAPIFNPINSSWVAATDVWGYSDPKHDAQSLPRRATIITQSRVSKRLLDIMHVENLRGNHISSEMTAQTVALLHGLKAVYAPMPVFFDRKWPGKSLEKWFNGGPRGESGNHGSAMGWGREARFGGSTWYYRATPPQRLYLNWMGWEDTGIGGKLWEERWGRPCLPPMMLHPVKDVEETPEGFVSESRLPYS